MATYRDSQIAKAFRSNDATAMEQLVAQIEREIAAENASHARAAEFRQRREAEVLAVYNSDKPLPAATREVSFS